jgi:hypothetical protein
LSTRQRPAEAGRGTDIERRTGMRKLMHMSAAFVAGTLSLQGASAQQQDPNAGMEATGTVTEADEDMKQITVGDETFFMPEQAGTVVFPQVGDKVTLFYEQKGDRKVITRIGQPQN